MRLMGMIPISINQDNIIHYPLDRAGYMDKLICYAL